MLKTVMTENGQVRGISAADPRIIAYKGIPFAAPPVGELRWKAPQPAADWEGVRDCVQFAPIAMQNIPGLNQDNLYAREWHVDPEIPMAEDCLYLNVWTPAKKADEKLPVYVWYFGGGLQEGYPAEMEFDGERLARRGIVVVTVNYRVNVFGFFAHPELTGENPEAPTNFGHLDQQYGLFWTKRNIAAFGGDPDNITIGGQSAGGGSVMTQLNHPGNQGYIQKAIVDSGIFLQIYADRPRNLLSDAEKRGVEFFDYLGVKTLEEARAIPAEELRDKNLAFHGFWVTAIDGKFQNEVYMKNMFDGKLLDVPMLLGHTNNEFFNYPDAAEEEDLKKLAKDRFGEYAEKFLALTGRITFAETKMAGKVHAMEAAVHFLCRRMEQLGSKSARYYYDFGPEIPGWDNPGAFHSSDLWFFFETLSKCWRPFTGKHYDLSRQMCNYWVNFIKNGNPNGEDADGTPMEEWKPFTEKEKACMTFYEKPKAVQWKLSPLTELIVEASLSKMGK